MRRVILGECVAPFRVFRSCHAVIPVDPTDGSLLCAADAARRGHVLLASWLERVEELWRTHGRGGIATFDRRLDHMGGLTRQLGVRGPRLVYNAAGTSLSAAVLRDPDVIVDHTLYWIASADEDELLYLAGVLDTTALARRVSAYQSRGETGARGIDTVVWHVPVPRFDPGDPLHAEIVALAREAGEVAADVPVGERDHFVTVRRRVRAALRSSGVAARLDAVVGRLLAAAESAQTP